MGISSSAQADELCQIKQVKRIKQQSCESRVLPYRDGSELTTIEVAAVGTGWKAASPDLLESTFVYVVRTRAGKIERLKQFPYFAPVHRMIASVQGGQAYDSKFVERVGDKYCATYVGTFPFTGQLTDCGDLDPASNTLRYGDGVTSAEDAFKLICAIVESETRDKCGSNAGGVYARELVMTAPGQFVHRLKARIRVRAYPELERKTSYGSTIPVEYDERMYEVGLKGEVTLIEQCRTLEDWSDCTKARR
jgi:hypothetical protein